MMGYRLFSQMGIYAQVYNETCGGGGGGGGEWKKRRCSALFARVVIFL